MIRTQARSPKFAPSPTYLPAFETGRGASRSGQFGSSVRPVRKSVSIRATSSGCAAATSRASAGSAARSYSSIGASRRSLRSPFHRPSIRTACDTPAAWYSQPRASGRAAVPGRPSNAGRRLAPSASAGRSRPASSAAVGVVALEPAEAAGRVEEGRIVAGEFLSLGAVVGREKHESAVLDAEIAEAPREGADLRVEVRDHGRVALLRLRPRPVLVEAEVPVAEVVREDQDDVRPRCGGGGEGQRKDREERGDRTARVSNPWKPDNPGRPRIGSAKRPRRNGLRQGASARFFHGFASFALFALKARPAVAAAHASDRPAARMAFFRCASASL